MKKIHYTIYNGNYEKGQDACPACNDKKHIPHQYLTMDIDKVTCKKCLKGKIKSANFALDVSKHMVLFDHDKELINDLIRKKEMAEERLKYLEGEQS